MVELVEEDWLMTESMVGVDRRLLTAASSSTNSASYMVLFPLLGSLKNLRLLLSSLLLLLLSSLPPYMSVCSLHYVDAAFI